MNRQFKAGKAIYRILPVAARDSADPIRLFLISSDGVAADICERDRDPEVDLMAHGATRYARQGTAFSYGNCMVATSDNLVVAMNHAFEMPESDGIKEVPVLQPYSRLEAANSFYKSGIAVDVDWRGQGIGSALLDVAETIASNQGCDRLSLICLEAKQDAFRLYCRRCFVEIDRRLLVPHPCLQFSAEDALLMRLVPVN